MKKFLKGTLSLLLAVIMVISVAAPALPSIQLAPKASAATFNSKSTISLVTPKNHKSASTHYMYGNADYLCIRIDSTTDRNDMFYFVLYSDSAYKTKIGSYSTSAYKGTTYIDLPLDLTSLKTKTYYAKVYVKKYNYDTGKMATDSKTVKKYTVKVNKKGTSLDKMNTVMYGYENTENGLRVYWYKVPKATKYYVYRRFSSSGSFTKIGTVKATSDKLQSFVDKKNIESYAQYKVVATDGTKKTPSSLVTLNAKALKTPKVSVECIENNYIHIKWDSVADRKYTKYTLLYRTDSTDWTVLHGPQKYKMEYKHNLSDAKGNENYYYTVIAEYNGEVSGYDTKNGKIRFIRYPVLKKCTYPEEGGITVNWELSDGADGYIIYRQPQNGASWTQIAKVSKGVTSYTDLTADNTMSYTYTVRATYKGKNGSMYKKGVVGAKLDEPVIDDITSDDNVITFSWDDTNGEKFGNYNSGYQYIIYQKTESGWKKMSDDSYGISIKDNTATCKVSTPYEIGDYTYSVQLKCRNNVYFTNKVGYNNYLSSSYDKVGTTVTVYPDIKFNEGYATAEGLRFSWSAPVGAEDFAIYRKTENSEYELLGETSENQFVDTTAQKDVLYTYKVVYKYNGELIESAALEKQLGFKDETIQLTFEKNVLDDGFLFSLGDEEPGVKYYQYEMTDSGWHYEGCLTNNNIFLNINNGGKYSLGFVKVYNDTWVTTLNETPIEIQLPYIPKITSTVKDGKITFKWEDMNGSVDSFDVYLSAKGVDQEKISDKTYIATVNASELEYTYEMSDNTLYVFSFRAKKGDLYSTEKSFRYNNMAIIDVSYNYSGEYLYINWNRVSDVDGYSIYYRNEGDQKWKYLYDTDVTDYTSPIKKSNILGYLGKKCRNIEVCIRAKDSAGKKCKYTASYITVPVVPSPAATGSDSYDYARSTSDGLKLEFGKVSGCDKYIIEYYNTNTKKWVKLGTSVGENKNYYLDKKIKVNEQRKYRVYAVWNGVKGAYNEMDCIRLKQPTIKLKSSSKGVVLTATKYDVKVLYKFYSAKPNSSKWSVHTRSYTNEITDKKAKNGSKYKYTVRVERKHSKSKTYSVSSYNTKGWTITYKK